jgi:hypothetical protein
MPPVEVTASVSLSYAEGVKHRSPGQVTASRRAATPPWVVDTESPRSSVWRGYRGTDAETATGQRLPLILGQQRSDHGSSSDPAAEFALTCEPTPGCWAAFSSPDPVPEFACRQRSFRPRQTALHTHATRSADASGRPSTQGGAYVRVTHVHLPWALEGNAFSVRGVPRQSETPPYTLSGG